MPLTSKFGVAMPPTSLAGKARPGAFSVTARYTSVTPDWNPWLR